MKETKARKLKCCSVDFSNVNEASAFDALLSRVLGANSFSIKKKPKACVFVFWATQKELDILDNLWDQILDMKWNEEEFEEVINK